LRHLKEGRLALSDYDVSRRIFLMRRMIYTALLGLILTTSVGCLIPAYSGNRVRRTQQMIFNSEDQRSILNFWERFWHLDQPDHMNSQRVHGGVI
jgi:hypothetical protein